MWCTPMRSRSRAYASALAYTTPTSSAPTSPGPWVTATASTALHETPASARARSTTAGRAARCARLASSGTTPPNTLWMSWDRMTRLASSGRPGSPTSTAAEVSSQDVSMPRTTSATADPPLEDDGVGPGAGDDPRRRGHGEARVPARACPDQMRHAQQRGVDRDGPEKGPRHGRDRHRHGRDRVDPGEALLGSHEARHARHQGEPAQHVARLRLDADERDDLHVLARD